MALEEQCSGNRSPRRSLHSRGFYTMLRDMLMWNQESMLLSDGFAICEAAHPIAQVRSVAHLIISTVAASRSLYFVSDDYGFLCRAFYLSCGGGRKHCQTFRIIFL